MRKAILTCLCLLLFGSVCQADGITVLGGCFKIGLAVWGFSTGGSSYVAVSATIFLVGGTVQLFKGIAEGG